MKMINIKTKMPWIYVGKTGTGKTTKALECLPPDPINKLTVGCIKYLLSFL